MSTIYRRWTPAEDFQLLGLLERHISYAEIAVALDRSIHAVRTRMERLGDGGIRTAARDLSAAAAARLLGVEQRALARWIRQGFIPAARTAVCYRRGALYAIRLGALEAFVACEPHWHRVDPERITHPGLRALALEARGGRYFVRLREVETRLYFARNTAHAALRRGRLRAVRDGRGPWLVRDDWLADMLAPRRSSEMSVWRRLTPVDRAEIVRCWGVHPVPELARRLGVSKGTVFRAARRLGLVRLGRGYWRQRWDRRRERVS